MTKFVMVDEVRHAVMLLL